MKNAFGSALQAFGSHIEGMFAEHEARLKTLDTELGAVKEKLALLEEDPRSSENQQAVEKSMKEFEELKKEIQDVKDAHSSAGVASAPPSVPSHVPLLPYDQRVIARIGNLGWDDTGGVVVTRAKEVLQEAGVQDSVWKSMAAVNPKKGSPVDLFCATPNYLKTSRLAVKSLDKTFARGKFVWLDAKKEWAETRPTRMVHRVHDCLADFEVSRQDKQMVEKDTRGKIVKVAGQRMGFTLHGEWRWTDAAMQRYSAEELEMARAYVEEE